MLNLFRRIIDFKKIEDREDSVILGYGVNVLTDEREIVEINWSILNRHIYLLGSTGAGKTVLLRNIAYQVVNNNWGLIYIDLKGGSGAQQALHDIWRACVKSNRENDFHYFSPILSEQFCQKTDTWNPLARGDYIIVTEKLYNSFHNAAANASFYEDVKYDLLLKLIKAFKSTQQIFTFEDIAQVMSSKSALQSFAKSLKDVDDRKTILNLLEEWDANEMQFVKNTKSTVVSLQKMSTEFLKDVCNSKKTTLDLYDVLAKRQIVFCYLPTMLAKFQMRALAKMLLSELRYICSNVLSYTNKRTKTVIIIDEFEELVFESIKDLFNKAREAGISMIVSHQTLSDINYETNSNEFAKSLLDNTATKLIMQIKSKESAEMLAKNVGELNVKIKIPFLGLSNYIIPPEVLMGRNEMNEDGLDVGELIAKIDSKIYRSKVPYPTSREKISVGVDIPKIKS